MIYALGFGVAYLVLFVLGMLSGVTALGKLLPLNSLDNVLHIVRVRGLPQRSASRTAGHRSTDRVGGAGSAGRGLLGAPAFAALMKPLAALELG
jgi:hypothetical protein